MIKGGVWGRSDVMREMREMRDMPYTYKGRKTILKDIKSEQYPHSERRFGIEDGEQNYTAAIRAFKQRVKAESDDGLTRCLAPRCSGAD